MDERERRQLAVSLTKAKKEYEKGKYAESAGTLAKERVRVVRSGDSESLALVDDWIAQLGGSLQGSDREAFDGGLDPSSHVIDVSPVGLVLAALGAVALLISVFLPYADASSAGFAVIQQNTLIQNGAGWAFVIFAVIGAIRVYGAYRARTKTWAPIVTGLLAIGFAVYFGSNGGDSLQLCSVATGTNCQIANPGTGVYLAGIGGLLMVVGGWLILNSKKAPAPESTVAPPVVATLPSVVSCK